MAIPAPIEMPSPLPVNAKSFDLNRSQEVSPVGSGFIQTIETASPFWIAKYSTPPLTDDRDQAFQAFLDQLEGALNPFLAFDPRRPRPFAYLNSNTKPWEADHLVPPLVDSASYLNGTLTLKGLIPSALLTRGDYISYKRGNAWYLHRVTANITANGSGIVTAVVTPRPLTSSTDVVARLEKACCAMKIMGAVQKDDAVESRPKYTFNAVQFTDRST